jgi:hypothetical protein
VIRCARLLRRGQDARRRLRFRSRFVRVGLAVADLVSDDARENRPGDE